MMRGRRRRPGRCPPACTGSPDKGFLDLLAYFVFLRKLHLFGNKVNIFMFFFFHNRLALNILSSVLQRFRSGNFVPLTTSFLCLNHLICLILCLAQASQIHIFCFRSLLLNFFYSIKLIYTAG